MRTTAIALLLVSFLNINAQPKKYFQQQTNYKIDVTLNDATHELKGYAEIEYTNNSPDTLKELFFHLWPNAYKNTHTAYAKQAIENKDTKFWFSKKDDKGYIDELDFRADGSNATWALDSVHIDICRIELSKPLAPGGRVVITTPFHVKLPKTFSRLGHEGQSYQITQWYPKPAVYDKDGWHPMPYLDQGEFYSEYGKFEVAITLPKNYVVGATGYLQDSSEIKWLDELAEKTKAMNEMQLRVRKNPASDTTMKTLHYIIDNVHDFAWFADKRYHVLKGEVELPESKRKVTTWVMFTDVNSKFWKDAIPYVNEAVENYSKWIGEYPYDVCTAVQGALSAGGGMEYPTITIIGRVGNALALETVIVHEVGHNWFYGILGSNERRNPWMDEGINSFYEERHIKTKYPDDRLIGKAKDKGINKFLGVERFKADEFLKIVYETVASYRMNQPLGEASTEYTSTNYGAVVYGKGGWAMEYLSSYLGSEVFDKAMHEYFNRWKFKHPQPVDLKNVLEEVSGKNLNWFFGDMLTTNHDANYKIASVKKATGDNATFDVRLKNKNGITYPISLGTYNKTESKNIVWLDGFKKDTTITLSKPIQKSKFCLDCENNIPTVHHPAFFTRKPIKLKFLAAYDRPDRHELFFTPWFGWNNYDKTTLGLALYNHTIPNKKFTFELVPQYAFGTKTIVGMGRIGYTFYLNDSKIHNINFGVQGRRFGWQIFPEALMYNKFQPTLSFDIKPKHPRRHMSRTLVLRNINVWQETDFYNRAEGRKVKETQYYYVNEAGFYCVNARVINPISWNARLQQSTEFVKLFAEANFKITYNKPNKGLNIRFFAGGFLWENITSGGLPDPRFRMNFSSGFGAFIKDYTFDEFLLGRSDFDGFLSQQVVQRDGGFKTLTSFGQTNVWLSSFNISSSIPTRIPIKPFISFGAYGSQFSKFNFAFEAGITIFVLEDVLELHIPIATIVQADFGTGKETYKWSIAKRKDDGDNMNFGSRYRNLITFTFNLTKLNPFTRIKKLEF
jgi:hypothetical protein